MKSIVRLLSAAGLAFALGTSAQAAPVNWGVNASFGGISVIGTVIFDDTPVQGFYDGIADANDTHVTGDFVLSSTGLGWTNAVFTSILFQPYFYSTDNDGPHIDGIFSSNGWSLVLGDFNNAALNSPTGAFQQGSWSFDRGRQIPEPTSLALLLAGLAALGLRRGTVACTR